MYVELLDQVKKKDRCRCSHLYKKKKFLSSPYLIPITDATHVVQTMV